MAHNADIVTARTRLRRLLSLRSTPSFKNTSLRSAFPTVRAKRRRTMTTTEKKKKISVSTIKRSASVSEIELRSRNQLKLVMHECNRKFPKK